MAWPIAVFWSRRAGDPRRSLEAFRGGVAALNAWDSNSGMNLFRAAIAPLAGGTPFFGAVVATGSHAAERRGGRRGTRRTSPPSTA